jgi:hypothetical protein
MRNINPTMNSFVPLVILKQKSRPNGNRTDMECSISLYKGIMACIIIKMEFSTDG